MVETISGGISSVQETEEKDGVGLLERLPGINTNWVGHSTWIGTWSIGGLKADTKSNW